MHIYVRASSEEALVAPVVLPPHTDPAELQPMVRAIERALVLISHTHGGELIERADQLAEVASGLLEPGDALLEDRARRFKTMRAVFAAGGWLTAEQLGEFQDAMGGGRSQLASDWKRRARVYAVTNVGRDYFASYQFDAMYQPLPVIREVLKAYGAVPDPWALAAWFHFPNAWIIDADGEPVAPRDALLERADDVVRAAQKRRTSFVA